MGLRVHRSISWIGRAEDATDDDGRFIFLWIGFFFLVHDLLCSMRFEDGHPKIGKRCQSPLDAPSDLVPRKTAESGALRRYGNRAADVSSFSQESVLAVSRTAIS